MHCRGAGGGSSSSANGGNGYDAYVSGIQINNANIVVGTGGAYGADKGKRGGISSFGTVLEAPGGSPATGTANAQSSSPTNPFGSDYSDTSTGLGGVIAQNGSNGAVWLRIAV